jgi:hypothetical protein
MLELRSRIEKKISEATLERYPFPHLIIEDFFPQDVFRTILEANPFRLNAGQEWFSEENAPKRTQTPYWTRTQINFHKDQPFEATPEHQQFWGELKDCFLKDHWFEQIVFEKYREYFVLRFGELLEAPEFSDLLRKELFVQQHKPGYCIGPHTDIPTRIFTCIFSFADRPGFEEYGTQLCTHKNPRVRCWGNDHHSPDDFVVKKVAPYKPNNFVLFFKTRQSFHSVKPIDETVPNRRYGMQFQLYEPVQGLFTDLSEPEIMVAKIAKPV